MKSPRVRWAAPSRRFEVTYGEVVLFALFLACVLLFGIRDWVASHYIELIAERIGRIEASIVPLQSFVAQRGAPGDVLDELRRGLDASNARSAVIECAILKRVGGDMRICAALTPTPEAAPP